MYGASSSQPRERRVPGDRRDGPAEPARRPRATRSSVKSRRRVRLPESTPCSSATVWANRRAKRYGSPRPYETFSVQVQAKPGGPRVSLGCGQQARLAHAGLATTTTTLAASGRAGIDRSTPVRTAELVASDRRAGRARRHGTGSRHRSRPRRAARGASRASTGRAARPNRDPRSRGGRGRRRRVAPSSRISPGRASDWMRAAVVMASPVRPQVAAGPRAAP